MTAGATASRLDVDQVEGVDADRFIRAVQAGGADALEVLGRIGTSKRSN